MGDKTQASCRAYARQQHDEMTWLGGSNEGGVARSMAAYSKQHHSVDLRRRA